VLKHFICWKPVFVLRKQIFWVVAPCGWVIASRRFEGNATIIFRVMMLLQDLLVAAENEEINVIRNTK
jgi:hypothetical protein